MNAATASADGVSVPIAALPVVLAACLSLPLFLPIPGFEGVPPFAVGAAIFFIPVLCAQLCVDAVYHRPGSTLRLVALLFVLTSGTSWIVGVSTFGANGGAALSLLNWIALMGLVIAGQMLLGTPQRISWLFNIWAASYACAAAAVIVFLAVRFGSEIFTSTNRVPLQAEIRRVFISWPNYFGVAVALAICIVYGRILTGSKGILARVQLVTLIGALMLTFSRGAYLACAIGIVTMTFVARRRLRAVMMLASGVVVAVVATLLLPAVRFQFMATFTLGTSQNLGLIERLAFAREALLIWLDHPTFGIGFNRFADFADESLVYSDATLIASQLGSVHNEFVTTLLKGGLVVAAAFLLFLLYAASVLRSAVRHDDPVVRQHGVIGYGIAATVLSACVATESLRTIAVSGIFWALIGGLESVRRLPAQGKAAAAVVIRASHPKRTL